MSLKNLLAIARKTPGTIALVLLLLIIGIYTHSLWQSAESTGLITKYGYGLPAFADGHWWTVLTGAGISPHPWMFILIVASVVFGCGYMEYHYGTLRMLAVILITHIGSVLLTAGILATLSQLNIGWAVDLAGVRDVGLSNAGFGAIGTASAGFTLLWRRRVRVIMILFCITTILYSGVIWDISHLLGFLIGIAMGPWVTGHEYKRSEFPLLNLEPRVLIAGLASLSIYSTIVTKLFPGNGGIINFDGPAEPSLSLLATIVSVILMSLFVYGLYKGKRFAWWAVLALSSLSALITLLLPNSGLKFFDIGFSVLLASLLITYRKHFQVRADALVRKKIILWFAFGFAVTYILHISLIYSVRQSITPVPSLLQIAAESAFQIFGQTTQYFISSNSAVNFLINSISLVWVIALLALIATAISSTARARDARVSFDAFDRLMRTRGATSVTWMARWPSMSYWTNSSETAAFAYRLINNVAIVLSDPVGSQQAIVSSIQNFHDFCDSQGWSVAYFSVTEKYAKLMEKRGYKSILIGEDTIIRLDNLEFAGKNWQSVRSAFNKAEKANIAMRSFQLNEAPLAISDQLRAIADSWVADKSLPEMGFTLGTLKEAADPEVVMHIAIDPDGTVHGMTSWMPIYRDNAIVGWTIDIMQRRLSDQTIGGVIEFLIAKSAIEFKEQGAEYISLSAAPLANSHTDKTSIEKLLAVLADRLEPYYGFKSLYRFKQKFNPIHEPMYLCYDDEAKLPAISAAIGKAYMNDASLLKTAVTMVKK